LGAGEAGRVRKSGSLTRRKPPVGPGGGARRGTCETGEGPRVGRWWEWARRGKEAFLCRHSKLDHPASGRIWCVDQIGPDTVPLRGEGGPLRGKGGAPQQGPIGTESLNCEVQGVDVYLDTS